MAWGKTSVVNKFDMLDVYSTGISYAIRESQKLRCNVIDATACVQ